VSDNEEFKVRMVSDHEYQLISLKHGFHICLLENETIGVCEPESKLKSVLTNKNNMQQTNDFLKIVLLRNQENHLGFKMMNGSYLSSQLEKDGTVVCSKYLSEHESFRILSQNSEENLNSLFKHDSMIGIKNTKYDGFLSSLLIQKNEIEYFKVERIDWNKVKLKNKNDLYLTTVHPGDKVSVDSF
jgi:hypothetical protein